MEGKSALPPVGGRPRNTLVERVLDGSFHPVRYRKLLAKELLPEEPPRALFPDGDTPVDDPRARASLEEYRRRLWEALCDWQAWYRFHVEEYERAPNSFDSDNMRRIAEEFSLLVHHLHGGGRPRCFTNRLKALGYDEKELAFLDFDWYRKRLRRRSS